jgi:tRNA(Ile)-lysidine synthase
MAEARRLTNLAATIASLADLPEGPLAVALSGGADSAALLWTCARLDRRVRAVHVHHGLEASDLMLEAARAVAHKVHVPIQEVWVEVGAGPSPEDQARRARYRALGDARRPGEWVLTAHTSDDQSETVLDHLLRASGIDGLSGIPSRRPPFARPFLAVTRSQTRELATLAGLPWRDDPVNQSDQPLRNRIRRRLLPMLEAQFNPALRASLATTAGLLARDAAYMDDCLEEVSFLVTDDSAQVAASVVTTVPEAAAARIIRRLLALAGRRSPSPEAVAAAVAVARGEISSYQMGGGITVRRRGAMLVACSSLPLTRPASVQMRIPGTTEFGRWRFRAMISDTSPMAMPIGSGWMVGDADRLRSLSVEAAAGVPDALAVLAAAGVGATDRPAHPVVVAPAGPVWAPSVRRFPLGWVDAATNRYLVIHTQTELTWRKYRP